MHSIFRVGITLLVTALAIVCAVFLWRLYMLSPWTRDARVRADVVTIAPDVSGWVVDLRVKDNQYVKEGEVIMYIDRDRYEANYENAKYAAENNRQQMLLKEHEATRRAHLGTQAISAEVQENAQIEAAMAKAAYEQSMAQLRIAELNLERSEVRAPRSGQITNLQLVQGNFVNQGQSVMALVVDGSFYIQAYFEETKLPRIQKGDMSTIRLMSGSTMLKGRVESISWGITDTNATPDKQLLANVEPTFNWVRLAQRIPVRIAIEENPSHVKLAAGMTASVSVEENTAGKPQADAPAAGVPVTGPATD